MNFSAWKRHEAHLAPVGQRRDHVSAKALARHSHNRGLLHRGKAATASIIGAKLGLVAPEDPRLLALDARGNLRIELLRDRLVVSFKQGEFYRMSNFPLP